MALSQARVSLFDWGFTRSDATYDVASVWKGAFFRLDTHVERFFASLQRMRLQIPYSRAELRELLHGCVRGAGLQEAYVAMVCTRGVPPKGARDPRLAQNRFYAYAVPYVWIAPESVDPRVKNYHWIDLVQSMFDAYDRGRDTSVVVDAQGNIAEGPGFNVFMVKGGVVRTADAACRKACRAARRSSSVNGWRSRCASRRCRRPTPGPEGLLPRKGSRGRNPARDGSGT